MSKKTKKRLIYGTFIFLQIFSLHVLGTVEMWSLTIMEILAILALFTMMLGERKMTFCETPGFLPLVFFLVYMLIQLVPLPASLVIIYPFPLALLLFFHYDAWAMHESLKQRDKQGSLKQRIKLGKSKFPARKKLAVPALSSLAACLVFNACLILIGGALAGKSWGSSNDVTWIQVDGEKYGAQADQRGPIGGGRGYTGIVTTGDFVVANLDQLLDALGKVKGGQVIFIPGQVEIDCTARVYIEELVLEIPGDVTLASNRGDNGSKGALIYSDALKTPRLIRPMGPEVRITSLRIRGPNPKRYIDHHRRSFAEGRDHYYYKFPTSRGIEMNYPGLEVDNCEISGFSHAAIYLAKGDRHQIHHNYIHHCQYAGLGYGVSHRMASSLIERNLFDFNRHSIAGTGVPGSSYEARHNVELGTSLGHCFDMHGGRDRKDGTIIAGNKILIHHNTFRAPNTPISIRGVPDEVCKVYGNWFQRHMSPQEAVRAFERTVIQKNAYGTLPVRVIE